MRVIALFCNILIILCGNCVVAKEDIDEPSQYFAKNYSPFDGRSFQEFEDAVPETSRFDTLAKILEKADSTKDGERVQLQIIVYLSVRKLHTWKDHSQLHALIMERSRGDSQIRPMVFSLICETFHGEMKRTLVMTFLGDPLDSIRSNAITQIHRLDDSQKVLESYVRQHESKKEYETSVAQAKRWIKYRADKKLKEWIKAQPKAD